MTDVLPPCWQKELGSEFKKPYMTSLRGFLKSEITAGKDIYPPNDSVFSAYQWTPLSQVKVVIIGQDPYHGPNQAHGLCFSVQPGVRIPPSLRNIYKELNLDIGVVPPSHGYLKSWSDQGVLLLNSVLTVEAGSAASHQGKGWETFTDRTIEVVNEQCENVVFLLWGKYAMNKGHQVDKSRHLVQTSVHPSPLSASRGFFGNHHFSNANKYLKSHGKSEINWQIQPVQ